MKKIIFVLMAIILIGCNNSNLKDPSTNHSAMIKSCGFVVDSDKHIDTSLKNANIELYPGYSFNYQVIFTIVSNSDLSNKAIGVSFDQPVYAELVLYDNEIPLFDQKDYNIANGLDYQQLTEEVLSGDFTRRSKAADELIEYTEGFGGCLTFLEESDEMFVYAYTALLTFDNPPKGTTITQMTIHDDKNQYVFEIGQIAFNQVDFYSHKLITGATRGNVGYSSSVSSKKIYNDMDGNLSYEFSALDDLNIVKVVPTQNNLSITDLKIRINSDGREYVKQIDSPNNIDVAIKQGDEFSLIVSYESTTPNGETIYYQTYNSEITFSNSTNSETFILESGIIRTLPTIFEMTTEDKKKIEDYYFEYLEKVDDNWMFNP